MANDPAADRLSLTIHATLDRLAGDLPRLGIALSGGGDSTALMHLTRRWVQGRTLIAATVDHGLRPESAHEARQAGAEAAGLGIPHEILPWQRDQTGGNLMAQAREARLRLLSDWAHRHDLSAVLLGHTLDDQAETLLMRLARGAGVDGLSGMAEARQAHGMLWLRPMLQTGRKDLRGWLTQRGIGWIDDPSNENSDYERVRIRKALAALDLPPTQLAQTAANVAMARDALQDYAAQVAEGAEARLGSLILPMTPFRRAPLEIRRRLLVAGLRFVSGADYPPRREAVLRALSAAGSAGRITLEGTIIDVHGDRLRLLREPAAACRSPSADPWDNRWIISGLAEGESVSALGHDALPDWNWRDSGLTRDEAASTPAIRLGGEIRAAPVLKSHPRITATPLRGLNEFRAMLYTH
ncbi:tRNA lysidine(34) synthetase TilS [Paracoccus shanxieyensis]|uniref:tRNA(Ile)-lysidine synthase n=1 Tax=Paracoccus shanxieyensis TaxID=2675752 RepID=A0A6L6IWV9_9RHOB|nr:tRNA lysidine(34) synthetase TilS [Paracoccus shanxieyensis]MTH63094.1 tRNA lysidine(34) synthetase TilS [Paracoccus shanxieyensis]MTH88987.1 tRNA lysidine(34) synthetase TilS [Paracoccus shanxieyensis]